MTTTALNAALSVGGTPGVIGATKTTAQAATAAFVVAVEVTLAAGFPNPRPKECKLWYSSSSFSYSAANAAVQLKPTARCIDLPIPISGSLILARDATIEALTGQYIYVWLETEGFSNPFTVNVNLVEI